MDSIDSLVLVTNWNVHKSLELIAMVCGIVQVLLAYRNIAWNFVFGIISSSIFIYLFAFTKAMLFAEAGLQLYYVIMGCYGLIKWNTKDDKRPLPITFTNKKEWFISSLIVIVSTTSLYYILNNFTKSNVPFWDALVSAFAFAGTWLMARRKLENWLLLNVSNFIAIPLLLYKELYFSAGLTLFLFIVAVMAYTRWKRSLSV